MISWHRSPEISCRIWRASLICTLPALRKMSPSENDPPVEGLSRQDHHFYKLSSVWQKGHFNDFLQNGFTQASVQKGT